MTRKLTIAKDGDVISAAQWNELVRLAKREVTGPRVVKSPDGWHIRDAPRTEPGADNLSFVVIRSINDSTDRAVNVQKVKPTIVDGEWTGGFHTVGDEPFPMAVYPFQRAGDYQAFIWPDTALTEETCILPAILIDGSWYVMQYLRHRLAPPDTRVPITDCGVSLQE